MLEDAHGKGFVQCPIVCNAYSLAFAGSRGGAVCNVFNPGSQVVEEGGSVTSPHTDSNPHDVIGGFCEIRDEPVRATGVCCAVGGREIGIRAVVDDKDRCHKDGNGASDCKGR